jgi:hypothetical protein
VCGSFVIDRNDFGQVRCDLIRESLDVRAGRQRHDAHAARRQRLDNAQTIAPDGSG